MTSGYQTSAIMSSLLLIPAQWAFADANNIPASSHQRANTVQAVTAANSELTPATKVKKFSLANNDQAATTPPAPAKSNNKNSESQPGQFIPSEEISEDLSVSFPIDI